MNSPIPLSAAGRALVMESVLRTWRIFWPGIEATPERVEYDVEHNRNPEHFGRRYAILLLGTGPDCWAEGAALVEEIESQARAGRTMNDRIALGSDDDFEPFLWLVRRSSTAENAALIGADETDAVAGAHVDNDAAEWTFGRAGASPKARGWCLHLSKSMCFDASGSIPAWKCQGGREAAEEIERTRTERQDALAHAVFRMRASEARPRSAPRAHAHVRLTHGAVHRYLSPERSAKCPFCRVIPANIGTAEAPVFVIDERQCALPLGA